MIEVIELIKGIAQLAQGNTSDMDISELMGSIVKSKTSGKSLASKSRMNVCQFPLLVSDTVSFSAYNRVRNLLESLYATYLKMVIMNNAEIIDLSKGGTRAGLLRNIHQNDNANYGLSSSSDYYSMAQDIGIVDLLMGESGYIFDKNKINRNILIETNRKNLKEYNDNFNLKCLSEAGPEDDFNTFDASSKEVNYYVDNIRNTKSVRERESSYIELQNNYNTDLQKAIYNFNKFTTNRNEIKNDVDLYAKRDADGIFFDLNYKVNNNGKTENRHTTIKNRDQLFKELSKTSINITPILKKEIDNVLDDCYYQDAKYQTITDIIGSIYKVKKDSEDNTKTSLDVSKLTKAQLEIASLQNKRLLDMDTKNSKKLDLEIERLQMQLERDVQRLNQRYISYIKSDNRITKNNDLEPTVFELTVTASNGPGGAMMNIPMSVAVKCVTHLIPASEFLYFIPDALITRNTMLRFIKWTTGEIKFMRDFVLDLDNTKFEATTDKKSVKWWRHLKARRNASKIRGFMGQTGYCPNATIVLSTSDVDIIKLQTNIDLIKDVQQAYKLCDKYFLMHICVVDETNDTVSLFNMDSKNWDSYTFGNLQNDLAAAMKNSKTITLR